MLPCRSTLFFWMHVKDSCLTLALLRQPACHLLEFHICLQVTPLPPPPDYFTYSEMHRSEVYLRRISTKAHIPVTQPPVRIWRIYRRPPPNLPHALSIPPSHYRSEFPTPQVRFPFAFKKYRSGCPSAKEWWGQGAGKGKHLVQARSRQVMTVAPSRMGMKS